MDLLFPAHGTSYQARIIEREAIISKSSGFRGRVVSGLGASLESISILTKSFFKVISEVGKIISYTCIYVLQPKKLLEHLKKHGTSFLVNLERVVVFTIVAVISLFAAKEVWKAIRANCRSKEATPPLNNHNIDLYKILSKEYIGQCNGKERGFLSNHRLALFDSLENGRNRYKRIIEGRKTNQNNLQRLENHLQTYERLEATRDTPEWNGAAWDALMEILNRGNLARKEDLVNEITRLRRDIEESLHAEKYHKEWLDSAMSLVLREEIGEKRDYLALNEAEKIEFLRDLIDAKKDINPSDAMDPTMTSGDSFDIRKAIRYHLFNSCYWFFLKAANGDFYSLHEKVLEECNRANQAQNELYFLPYRRVGERDKEIQALAKIYERKREDLVEVERVWKDCLLEDLGEEIQAKYPRTRITGTSPEWQLFLREKNDILREKTETFGTNPTPEQKKELKILTMQRNVIAEYMGLWSS